MLALLLLRLEAVMVRRCLLLLLGRSNGWVRRRLKEGINPLV